MTRRCRLCAGSTVLAFEHPVLGNRRARFLRCESCGYLFAEEPDWLERAYASAISALDTGVAVRNATMADRVASFAWLAGRHQDRGLDYGGGSGLLVRMLRDRGLDFHRNDPLAENLFARGFEARDVPHALVTVVEVLEHLPDPIQTLNDVVERYRPQCIVATTTIPPSPVPPRDWDYYSFETGQHIGFFAERALDVLARSIGLRRSTRGDVHVFSNRPRDHVALSLVTSKAAPLLKRLSRRVLGSRVMSDAAALRTQARQAEHRSDLDDDADPPLTDPSKSK